MRILQVINSLGTGGAEKLMLDTIPLYVERGIEMDILLLWDNDLPFTKSLQEMDCCNIYILKKSSNYKHIYNLSSIFKLRKIITSYDLVHVHLFPAQYYTVLANILNGNKTKLLFTEHNTSNKRLQNPVFKEIEQFIYKRYKNIIAITNQVKEVLINKLNILDTKIDVIENGVNIDSIISSKKALRKDFNLKDYEKLLIMTAGFRTQKDQDTVIRALSKLPENYKLLLVGDGERKNELYELATSLDLMERISFLGVRSDVVSLIKMCDVAILSSHWEGFGLAAAESMACGIPTIASNVDGLAQIVSGGGILFKKGDDLDLKNKILELENEQYYDIVKERCLNKVRQYNIIRMIDKHISLYEEVYRKG